MSHPFPAPVRALWEFTYRCSLRCRHCLVHGGEPESRELDTREALSLVDSLAELGVKRVVLTGGDPLLRQDWHTVARHIVDRQMVFQLSTSGHHLNEATLEALLKIPAQQIVLSVDGLRDTHDYIRQAPGVSSSFQRVIGALEMLRDTPIAIAVLTTVFQHNLKDLPEVQSLLKIYRVHQWTVQLAHATGRARQALSRGDLLTPDQLPALAEWLSLASRDPDLPPLVYNSIGYLSREEPRLRQSGRSVRYPFWRGCQCGISSIGIEPDGGIKGCANQIGAPFVVGNIRTEPLLAVWNDRARWHWLVRDPTAYGGACATCTLRHVCGAGCKALALASSGSLWDNPYCIRAIRRASGDPHP